MSISQVMHSTKDPVRVVYHTANKTFARLFIEDSLEEVKDVVRAKLHLGPETDVSLKQIDPDGLVDLEDDDDFRAFRVFVKSCVSVNIEVTLGASQTSERPAASMRAPSLAKMTAGQHSKSSSPESSAPRKKLVPSRHLDDVSPEEFVGENASHLTDTCTTPSISHPLIRKQLTSNDHDESAALDEPTEECFSQSNAHPKSSRHTGVANTPIGQKRPPPSNCGADKFSENPTEQRAPGQPTTESFATSSQVDVVEPPKKKRKKEHAKKKGVETADSDEDTGRSGRSSESTDSSSDSEREEEPSFFGRIKYADHARKGSFECCCSHSNSARTLFPPPTANPIGKHYVDCLMSFSNKVWNDPQAILKTDNVAGVEYLDLSKHQLASRFLLGEVVTKILVRQEYRDALEALENNELYRAAAYVTGQPGIGKTFFLVYILVAHLSQKRPVAWYHAVKPGTQYVLFKETATVHPLTDDAPLMQCGPLWGLCDSNPAFFEPPDQFYRLAPTLRTIQTTSPRKKRWKGWSKAAKAKCYVMDIWSVKEITALAKLLERDVERMTHLANQWGGVPRVLLENLSLSDEEIRRNYEDYALEAVIRTESFLTSMRTGAFPNNAPSIFYFCRPRQSLDGTFGRTSSRAVVPTTTIRSILGEALQLCDKEARLRFFRSLSHHADTRQAAGHMYENWFHIFFCEGGTIECHWLPDPDQDPNHVAPRRSSRLAAKSSPAPTLTSATASTMAPANAAEVLSPLRQRRFLPPTLEALRDQSVEPPYYWVAPKSFLGIDCVLVLKDVIYAFQITISPEHKLPTDGLREVRNHLPSHLRDLPWKVVVIGDTASAKNVATSWQGRVDFPPKSKHVTIGWSVVDPVSSQVAGVFDDAQSQQSKDPDSTYLTLLDEVEVEDLMNTGSREEQGKAKKDVD